MDKYFCSNQVKNVLEVTLDINKTFKVFYNYTINYISIYGLNNIRDKVIFVINHIIDNRISMLNKEDVQSLYELIKLCGAYPLLSKINIDILNSIKTKDFVDYLILNLQNISMYYYNDKQIKVYQNVIDADKDVIFSAPTSYGKTHISLIALMNMLKEGKISNLLIIVPSKALINEYRKKILEFREIDGMSIHSTPYLESDRLNSKNIFIYTQERALIAINQFNIASMINAVLVDEAQILAETLNNRALLLMKLLTHFEDIPKIYLAPYVDNMYDNVIKNVVNSNKESYQTTINSNENMVSNKKYIIDMFGDENIRLYDATFSRKREENVLLKEVGKSEKYTNPTYAQAIKDIILNFSIFGINGTNSLFYIASKEESIKIAKIMSSLLPDKEQSEMSNRVKALINHLKDNIHEDFNLISFIRKGVAYHNAYLDNYTRRQLEYIISDKENNSFIDKLICTSTLESGVNLNAKNIFALILKRVNGDNPELKYANVLGRAARISANTQGNLFYVRMANNSKYERSFYESHKSKKIENKKVDIDNFLNESNTAFRTLITDNTINIDIKKDFLRNEEITKEEEKIIVRGHEYRVRCSNGLDYYIDNDVIENAEKEITLLTEEQINKYLNCLGEYEETREFVTFLYNIYNWESKDAIMKEIDLIATMLTFVAQGKSVKEIINGRIKRCEANDKKLLINVNRRKVIEKPVMDFSRDVGYEQLNKNNSEHINTLIVCTLDLLQNTIEYEVKKYIQDFIFRVNKVSSNKFDTEKIGNFVEFSAIDNKKVFMLENGITDSFAINEFMKPEYNDFFSDNKIDYKGLLIYIEQKYGLTSPLYYEIYDLIGEHKDNRC